MINANSTGAITGYALAIVDSLEHFRKRIAMFIGSSDDVRATSAYLSGIEVGADCCGCQRTSEDRFTAIKARGWRTGAVAPSAEMKERGMSDAEIVAELIEIEILAWQTFIDRNSSNGA